MINWLYITAVLCTCDMECHAPTEILNISTKVELSPEYTKYIFIGIFSRKLIDYIRSKEEVQHKLKTSSAKEKFSLLCKEFIEMTTDNNANLKVKMFWKNIHEFYFTDKSASWEAVLLHFEQYHTMIESEFKDYTPPDWQDIISLFSIPFAICISNNTKYTLCEYLTQTNTYACDFAVRLDITETNSKGPEEKFNIVERPSYTSSSDIICHEKIYIIDCVHDLGPLIIKSFERNNVIEMKSNIIKCFLDKVNVKLYKQHLDGETKNFLEFKEFIYEEAQVYIMKTFLGDSKTNKQKLAIKDVINSIGKHLIHSSNISVFQFSMLQVILSNFSELIPFTQQIIALIVDIVEFISFITIHVVDGMLIEEDPDFEHFLLQIGTMDWKSFKNTVEISNSEIQTVGHFILDIGNLNTKIQQSGAIGSYKTQKIGDTKIIHESDDLYLTIIKNHRMYVF